MKTITQYIFEKDSNKKNDDESIKLRSGIKFTIWKQPDQKVSWLKDNEKYHFWINTTDERVIKRFFFKNVVF